MKADGTLEAGDPGYVQPGTGLINSAPNQTSVSPMSPVASIPSYTPAQAQSTSYQATPFTVTPEQTVQGQLEKIINKDSPLMQQAATRANQASNARGLLNSSLAVGAGQDAVIAAATPIAQQDAATYNQAMTNTATAQNTASQFGAGATNTANLANAQAVNAAFTTAVNNIAQLTNTKLNNETQMALANLDATTKQSLALLDAQNRQLLQANANAANMFQETVKSIAGISVDATLNQAAKDQAIANQITLLQEGLATTSKIAGTDQGAIASLDLSQYFQPLTTPAPVQPSAEPPAWYNTPPAWYIQPAAQA